VATIAQFSAKWTDMVQPNVVKIAILGMFIPDIGLSSTWLSSYKG